MQKYETHDVLVAQPLARASLGVIFHHGKPSIFYVSLLTREEWKAAAPPDQLSTYFVFRTGNVTFLKARTI